MHEIETERLLLRRFVPEDLDAYHACMNDDDVMRHLPGGKALTREQAQAWIEHFRAHYERHDFGLWAVIFKPDTTLIGHGGLQYIRGTDVIEVSYGMAKSHWRRGIGTEIAAVSLRYGFEELKLERIIALADPPNTGSRRVMEKNGMRFVAMTTAYYSGELVQYVLERADFQPAIDYTLISVD